MYDTRAWAQEEFGHAELGDARRTKRLVALAAEVVRTPAATVTKACQSSASREGAYRLLENAGVDPDCLHRAAEVAAVRRCRSLRRIIVPIDGSSLTFPDSENVKGLGAVGTWSQGARGLHVMTALALTLEGAPLGICGQRMWTRMRRSPNGRHGARYKEWSENTYWTDLLVDTQRAFECHAPNCQPWFQMDRGADCWQVLQLAQKAGLLITVRAAHDRLIDDAYGYLWSKLEHTKIIARKKVSVAARPPTRKHKRIRGNRIKVRTKARPARVATVTIRAATVDVQCRAEHSRLVTVRLNAVLVREENHRKDRIEWMLLTTHPIRTRRSALEVVRGYTLRWRIEEFHRVWKRGLCRVEDSQLQSRNALFRWATILASVAARALRLTHLARTTPEELASAEFSQLELQAIIALREPKASYDVGHLTLQAAVRWVADIGGYTGPSHGPPGPTVIGRGLHDVLVVARALRNQRKTQRKKR